MAAPSTTNTCEHEGLSGGMKLFGCPLGTFLAYVVSFAAVLCSVVWALLDARRERRE